MVAGLLLILLVCALWPSPFSKVKNLGSRGSSVIAFGDSLTAGFGASAGEDYPSRLSTRSGIPIVNAGVSGDTTEKALERIDADVLARDPRVVIVGLGGNDFLQGVAIATEESLRRDVEAERAAVVRFRVGAERAAVALGHPLGEIEAVARPTAA